MREEGKEDAMRRGRVNGERKVDTGGGKPCIGRRNDTCVYRKILGWGGGILILRKVFEGYVKQSKNR